MKAAKHIIHTRTLKAGISIAVILFMGMLLPAICSAQQVKSKPGLFYAVTGNGLKDTSYLFGTFHLVKSGYMSQLPHVQQALQKSKGVVVETLIDSAKLPQLQAMSFLKDKTLSSMLDKPFSDSLDAELKNTLGMGLAQLDKFKPISITVTLSMIYIQQNKPPVLNNYDGAPLDIYFADYGKQHAKMVTPFETAEEQMDILFNKTSDAEQIIDLKRFIRHKDEMRTLGNEEVDAWVGNDLDKLQYLYDNYSDAVGNLDYLLKNRNLKWMTVLPALLQKQGQFVGVGALHLSGPDGLVEQLRKKGYTVTPLKL
ncbi:TraB/GumN family protein [Mucilaginibacter segetis]|uniref:TraB/GumN family protein n=1 Tax=Mucilaginibacter segetis TaxID=2793071 RepID=A0A934PW76_9SPHI|nr:TraB/GumN family protein [Mucilaginibacter segetis]MBK0380802.1 TraB/GumN family protein [Mucilaginibacter segetis]